MPFLDVALLLVIAFMVGTGAVRGFIASLLGLTGLVATAFVAIRAHPIIQDWLVLGFGASWSVGGQVLLFFAIFFVVSRLVGWGIRGLLRIFDVILAIPFTKSIDRLLGAVLGFIEGVILVALLVIVLLSVPSLPSEVAQAVDASWIVRGALVLIGVIEFLFPASWEVLRASASVV